MMDSIVLPKDDARCANILRMVINNLKEKERENESRSAASSSAASSLRYPNKVYALRKKIWVLTFSPRQRQIQEVRQSLMNLKVLNQLEIKYLNFVELCLVAILLIRQLNLLVKLS